MRHIITSEPSSDVPNFRRARRPEQSPRVSMIQIERTKNQGLRGGNDCLAAQGTA